MELDLFDYHLPEELIAQTPAEPRDHSRLLVLDKKTGAITHAQQFTELLDYLQPGDVLVSNHTKVLPARLLGVKEDTGAKIEVVLLTRQDKDHWEALVKPGKKVKIGTRISFGEGMLVAEAVAVSSAGGRVFRFIYQGVFEQVLDILGQMPLPPYITAELADRERYQTVYAKIEGSAAAPTAGLHFTEEMLSQLEDKGIAWVEVLLHIGLGTFRPVKAADIRDHHMHAEYYSVSQEAAGVINQAKEQGRRVIGVGTTAIRALESSSSNGLVQPQEGWTDIFIYPGYRFQIIDGMITNFHLPKSTLLMLISALAGREQVLRAYNEAVAARYRFFSFGDAMLII